MPRRERWTRRRQAHLPARGRLWIRRSGGGGRGDERGGRGAASRIVRSALLLILPAIVAPPLSAQQQGHQQQAASAPAAVADAPQPGDVIRLRVWREPDLSGEFPVNEDGIVVLPRLGPVDVTRVSADALEQRLIREYSRYLNHAAIELTLLRRVQILGAVRTPGIYPLDPTMTIADAIAIAGGPAPHGHPNKVELIRGGEKLDIQLAREARIADSPIRSGDQLYVPERSWFYRNSGIVSAALTASVSLIIAVLYR